MSAVKRAFRSPTKEQVDEDKVYITSHFFTDKEIVRRLIFSCCLLLSFVFACWVFCRKERKEGGSLESQ